VPGALESLDEILGGIDAGAVTAAEAIERVLGAQITLRNARRRWPPCTPAGFRR
jgi:hypothetical protein